MRKGPVVLCGKSLLSCVSLKALLLLEQKSPRSLSATAVLLKFPHKSRRPLKWRGRNSKCHIDSWISSAYPLVHTSHDHRSMAAPTVDEGLAPPSTCNMATLTEALESKSLDEPKPTSKVYLNLCVKRRADFVLR